LKKYHPEALRLFMLQSHYRSPVDYSEESLTEARSGLLRCYRTLQLLKEVQSKLSVDTTTVAKTSSEQAETYVRQFSQLTDKFNAAMDDDFNTAQALGHVFEMVRLVNNFIVDKKNMPDSDKANILAQARKVFDHFGAVLGVFQNDADQFFISDKETELRKRGLNLEEIEGLIHQRQIARQQKDWARADDIRKELARFNIVLKDLADSTSWMIE
jgi:cysteinyl-tRNA synthetase